MAHETIAIPGPWVKTPEPLLWLMGMGREQRHSADYYFRSSERTDPVNVCLQLTLRGAGFYQRDGVRTVLWEGMAFFDVIPSRFEYGYARESREPYELVFVTMAGAEAMAWHQRIHSAFGPVLNFGPKSVVASLMQRLVRHGDAWQSVDRYLTSARLYELLMTMWSELTRSRLALSPIVTRAVEIIERDAADADVSIGTIATTLDCTREHLSRAFHQAMGITAAHYLTQQRVRLAGRLLRETSDKLDRVARQSGFASANYLCRVFRQQVGVTCADFRKRTWIAFP